MTHNKDLHSLPVSSRFLTDIPICNHGRVQIQKQKRPLQKLRGKKVKSTVGEANTVPRLYIDSKNLTCAM